MPLLSVWKEVRFRDWSIKKIKDCHEGFNEGYCRNEQGEANGTFGLLVCSSVGFSAARKTVDSCLLECHSKMTILILRSTGTCLTHKIPNSISF